MSIPLRLFRLVKVEWRLFLLGLVLLGGGTIIQNYAPLEIQRVIDQVLTPVFNQGKELDRAAMLQHLGFYVGLIASASIIGYFASIILMSCANRIVEYIRNKAFDVMQNLPVSYFDDKPAGKVSSRIINDTETLRSNFYGGIMSQAFLNLAQVIIIYVFIFSLNWYIGLALLLLLPLFYFWYVLYSRQVSQAMKVFFEAQSEINSQVNETMNGSVMIQLSHIESSFKSRFQTIVEQMYQAALKWIRVDSTVSWSLGELLNRSFVALILAVVGYQFLGQTLAITVGQLFIYINYLDRLFMNLNNFVRQFSQIQQSVATGQRVLELLDAEQEVEVDRDLVVTQGQVEFKHVNFAYVPGQPVLKDLNLLAQPGQTIALVGHTGSGKSSMINLLFRFYDPQEGQILIDGQAIGDYSRESVRKEMGIVLQDPYLFTGTIASNVTMGNEAIDDAAVWQALERVGAKDMVSRLPEGIQAPVFEKGATYSSGERQLISFARTLAADPKILILDEATSHIDTETEEIIQHAMKVVSQGRTTLIIAHRLSTIQDADLILVLHEGQIVERGNHQTLLAQDGRYAEMYRMQLQQANG